MNHEARAQNDGSYQLLNGYASSAGMKTTTAISLKIFSAGGQQITNCTLVENMGLRNYMRTARANRMP